MRAPATLPAHAGEGDGCGSFLLNRRNGVRPCVLAAALATGAAGDGVARDGELLADVKLGGRRVIVIFLIVVVAEESAVRVIVDSDGERAVAFELQV